jgi:ornithine carbamoyltransferase
LLRTADLSRADVDLLLDTAAEFAKNPLRSKDALAHKSVAIYMTKPSTRTRLSSETAVAHLGGTPIFIRGDELQLGRGETIADTAKIISGYCDALIIRTFAQADVEELGANASIPVINALTDDDHPTQLLADWLTIRETFGNDIKGRKFVYLGDGNNMSHAWLTMGAIMGAHVVAATPSGKWAPNADVVAKAQEIAKETGATIEVTNDPEAAAKGASALYTDVWMSMGDPESERAEKIQVLAPFAITDSLMSLTASDSIFMHCLPAKRGEEVTADVIDSPASIVLDQAENRMHVQNALMLALLRPDIALRT